MNPISKGVKITQFRDIPQFADIGHYAVDYPIDRLISFLEDEIRDYGLQLNPEFQRGHVWTRKQQIAYVEFLLRGGRTGRDLYFNNPSWHRSVAPGLYNDYVCVDGLQRITAISRFIHNELPVFGSKYKEFTDSMRMTQDTIRIHINDLQTYEEVLAWYIEMNAGGTPHKKSEIQRVQTLLDAEKRPH